MWVLSLDCSLCCKTYHIKSTFGKSKEYVVRLHKHKDMHTKQLTIYWDILRMFQIIFPLWKMNFVKLQKVHQIDVKYFHIKKGLEFINWMNLYPQNSFENDKQKDYT